MNPQQEQIQAPVAKAVTALGAGATTSVIATSQQAASFWPQNYGEWSAAIASTVAGIYSIVLLSEWVWKRLMRPYLQRWGYVK